MHRKSIVDSIGFGGQNQVKVTKGYQVQIFRKYIYELLCTGKSFWPSWEIKIKNQAKVIKGHQVQILKKSIFELLCIEKTLWSSWEVKIRSRSPKIIKCKFSKSLFLISHVQKMHFGYHVRSNSDQGNQR